MIRLLVNRYMIKLWCTPWSDNDVGLGSWPIDQPCRPQPWTGVANTSCSTTSSVERPTPSSRWRTKSEAWWHNGDTLVFLTTLDHNKRPSRAQGRSGDATHPQLGQALQITLLCMNAFMLSPANPTHRISNRHCRRRQDHNRRGDNKKRLSKHIFIHIV